MFFREIHPELDKMHRSTHTRKLVRKKFIMQKSRSSRHPLHFIISDNTTSSRSILMLDCSLIYECHRLESSMWMKSDTRSMSIFLWFYFHRRIIVEHKKWARVIWHCSAISWHILRDMKSISHPVFLIGMLDACNSFLHKRKIIKKYIAVQVYDFFKEFIENLSAGKRNTCFREQKIRANMRSPLLLRSKKK